MVTMPKRSNCRARCGGMPGEIAKGCASGIAGTAALRHGAASAVREGLDLQLQRDAAVEFIARDLESDVPWRLRQRLLRAAEVNGLPARGRRHFAEA